MHRLTVLVTGGSRGIGNHLIAVAAAVSAVLYPGTEPAGRALITAVIAGVVAARVRHWLAAAVTAVAATLTLPLFLAEDATAVMKWGFSPLFVLALVLGRGFRFLARGSSQQSAGGRHPTGRATDDSSLFIWPDRRTAAPSEDTTDER